MSNNLRLPTGGSVNWGSNLNAYLESLNSRISGIESTISKTLLSGNRIIQNLGAYSSGLVGNRTEITYDKDTDTLTITDLNVYIGGDVLTYYDIGTTTYTKSFISCDSDIAYYVFLQYDIESDNFEIAYSPEFNSVNYTQVLLGVYFNKSFAPFYMSNLKTIAQHLDEFHRAHVDFDTNNVGIQINLKKTEYPSIQFGNLNIIDDSAEISDWSEVTEDTGPIFHMDGVGYNYDNEVSGDSKWYSDDTLLNQKVLNLKDPTIIYLQDSVSSNNVIISSIVDTTGTDTSFLPESDDKFRGHYYRILISVIDQVVIVQKSTETHFMNFSSYSIREQNLYNVKFNDNFLIKNEDEEYTLALDALFCVEVARFAVNDLEDYFNNSNSNSLLYQTGSVTYPSKTIQYTNTCAQMEAGDTEKDSGLYYSSTKPDTDEFAIESAEVDDLTFVKSNHSSWICIQAYEKSPCTETNFFDYWKLIDAMASLQANFVFVPSIEKGASSKTKWNIWQTTQGRIDCNVVDFATDKNSNPVTLEFNTPNAGDLSIKIDLLKGLPLCEAFESEDTETYNVLFTEHYAEEPIFLAAEKNISLVLNDKLSYEQPTSNEILIGNYCSGAKINIHDSAGGINITSNNLSLSVWSDNGSQSTDLITLTKTKDTDGNNITNIVFKNADIEVQDKKLTLSGNSYMEVTSDKRLKNNIKLYDVDALNIINNTPIVTFNYNNSTISTLGMIAQELKSNLLNPELLISVAPTANIKDLHTIHETKLIYVLWKAVQELSSELDSIKKNLILDASV